ncbi:MAG TPA: DUF2493 domain-containing protein [Rhodanobacteraceae bacterium]|nr:DUF2493 domain-containing protein [Rhodanobacteraceae bacterium]
MRRERNPNTLRVIVCGGREFNDKAMLSRVLWYVHERRGIAEVIHGGQRGAEQMANRWCFEMGIRRVEVRAEWGRYGSTKALMIRNRQMFALQPHGVIAFPSDRNSQTMVQSARELHVPVLDVEALLAKQKRRAQEATICEIAPGASAIHNSWRA